MRKSMLLAMMLYLGSMSGGVFAQYNTQDLVSFKNTLGSFPLVKKGKTAVFYSETHEPGVGIAFNNFKEDVRQVTGISPDSSAQTGSELMVIAGVVGKHPLIDQLIGEGKINVQNIKGTWENCLIQIVKNPFPGTMNALVIAGSDKRGAIFGIYSLSEQIGVSPWYWWADVPIPHQNEIFIKGASYRQGSPAVRYRGIFLNDEAPALSGWTHEKFGGFNHRFYKHVFELILRLKGNYLWPAMWGNAFYDDDPLNPILADIMGVVIGTSHHEPLMRAHDEWRRYGKGAWNYKSNSSELIRFWTESIERMGNNESIISVGMRGDGDEPMSDESNIELLEQIVRDQRNIIRNVTGKNPSEIPQLWALYKEVQDYYDKGMRVPDDVTLLLADDNWGNIRKLPDLKSAPRKGGYGVYYHFDYVGGPRNYKWLNTNPLPKIWEQMHLAYKYNANQIWIVNVGDLKPMEFPINFFLDYAWNPDKIKAEDLEHYTKSWAEQQFGPGYSKEIASFLSIYGKYSGRRKPELLNQHTYSLLHHREFDTVVSDYNSLKTDAQVIGSKLPASYQDAYYQLVLHPIEASANLHELYYAVAKNHLYASQNRISANREAERAKLLFLKDAQISSYYNTQLAMGKWNHMMDQTHIGYTIWQQPEVDKIPDLKIVKPLPSPKLGISIEGKNESWPAAYSEAIFPKFDNLNKQSYYLDLYNSGEGEIKYDLSSADSWIVLSSSSGTLKEDVRIWIEIDWNKVPKNANTGHFKVKGSEGTSQDISVVLERFDLKAKGYIPNNSVISIEASNYSNSSKSNSSFWKTLPDHGRTQSALTPWPVISESKQPGTINSPVVEYEVYFSDTGQFKIETYLSPSLDMWNTGGLKFAVSINSETPHIIAYGAQTSSWEENVARNINIQTSIHRISTTGTHVVKIWMVDPAVVIQKLVISPLSYKDHSYLGPPMSVKK